MKVAYYALYMHYTAYLYRIYRAAKVSMISRTYAVIEIKESIFWKKSGMMQAAGSMAVAMVIGPVEGSSINMTQVSGRIACRKNQTWRAPSESVRRSRR